MSAVIKARPSITERDLLLKQLCSQFVRFKFLASTLSDEYIETMNETLDQVVFSICYVSCCLSRPKQLKLSYF